MTADEQRQAAAWKEIEAGRAEVKANKERYLAAEAKAKAFASDIEARWNAARKAFGSLRLAHLEKLRVQISDCELIRDLATDTDKRAIFANLADHFKFLADKLEKEIVKRSPVDTGPGPQNPRAIP